MGKRSGRPRLAKNIPIAAALSARRDCREGRFIQIGNTLLLSPEYHALKDSSKIVYLAMSMEAGGRNEFIFPASAAKKYGIPSATLRRCIKELIDKKFIILTSSGKITREENFYSFCSDWKPP